MKKVFNFALLALTALPLVSKAQQTQKKDSTTTFKPHGHFSGYIFGDYYYKAHADSLKRGDYQYSKLDKDANAAQIRRVYLGYDYAISKKFSAKLLMDLTGETQTQKMSFYIKYANLRWKDIFPHSDLVIGEISVPIYVGTTGKMWGYRPIEATITNMHGANADDLGIKLTGKFGKGKDKNFGYNLAVGNGRGALGEDNKFKKFYGDVYGKFFKKHLTIDLYSDYERLNWDAGFHRSRNMLKLGLAYTSKKFTMGGVVFTNNLQSDVIKYDAATDVAADTINGSALGFSTFIRGTLIKNKLKFFVRYDQFNPHTNYSSSDKYYYEGLSKGYKNSATLESLGIAGLDFTPTKNVHFMPNIWWQSFSNQNSALGSSFKDYDLVYRLTFYFRYD